MAGQRCWGKAHISACLPVILLEGPEWERLCLFLNKVGTEYQCLGVRQVQGQVLRQKWFYSGALSTKLPGVLKREGGPTDRLK